MELLSCPDPGSLRNHLLGRYVTAASRTHPTGTDDETHDLADVYRRLAWLARGLGTRGEFTPHGLWRLLPAGWTRAVEAGMAAVPWLLLTVICTSVARNDDPAKVASILLVGTCGVVLIHCLWNPQPAPLPIMRRRSRKVALRQLVKATLGYGAVMALLASLLPFLLDERTKVYVELVWSDAGTDGEAAPSAWRYLLRVPGSVPFPASGCPVGCEPVSVVIISFLIVHGLMLALAPTVPRHVAFLLRNRGQLPWDLAPFLHWSHEAGLLRLSGSAYEFRHRELQDWLAANPEPAVTGGGG
ncbi:hypothetical protein ABZ896_10850 [Streptomyces sp. NPDC047072]|uniref:hypothetical protein n=1 Tax=Streptomyces sp. NPDC047072 TaxID=3154809 RepID=UPI0033C732DF